MILELYIKNIAIIGELRVRFGDGFNAVSYTHLDVYKRQV